MTHTYALLEVSPATFEEIRQKLVDAGYEQVHDGQIDMNGLALTKERIPNGNEDEGDLGHGS